MRLQGGQCQSGGVELLPVELGRLTRAAPHRGLAGVVDAVRKAVSAVEADTWHDPRERLRHVVKAWVNGAKIADVADSSPTDVPGRRLELVVSNGRKTDKDVIVRADDVRLSVPTP